MNKAEKIASTKQILSMAEDMRAVAERNLNLAAQIESTAKSALAELGVQPGRSRKGAADIADDLRLALRAGMTRKK
jgi:hypothetical protein